MTPQRAAEVLGLLSAEATSLRSVRAAFAQCVKGAHPDSSAARERSRPISAYQDARDTLLAEIEKQHRACTLCGGKGRVRAGMGWRHCGACDGTGEKG